jgi:hypothetical protein
MASGEVDIELGDIVGCLLIVGLAVDGIIVDTPNGLPEGKLLATVGTIDGPWMGTTCGGEVVLMLRGTIVGLADGFEVGGDDGIGLGEPEGSSVDCNTAVLGSDEGDSLGFKVGAADCSFRGNPVVEPSDGKIEGISVGVRVGSTMVAVDGLYDGMSVAV